MSRNVIASFDLQQGQVVYNQNLDINFLPKKVELTRISVVSDTEIEGNEDADDPNIFVIYMMPDIEPIAEVTVDGFGHSTECHDELNLSGFLSNTTSFRIVGLFPTGSTIGPNSFAKIVLHFKFT